MVSIEEISPAQEERGRNNPRYIERLSPLLPNFPAEVLSSWFGEHLKTVETYAFLGFDRFEFEKRLFPLSSLPGDEVLRSGSRSLKELANAAPITRLGLVHWMKSNRTWPVPPLLLNTEESFLPETSPIEFRRPYHLLEGYHRVALAHQLMATGAIDDPLPFWMVKIVPAPT